MGTQYAGIPSSITIPGALTIASMTGSGVNPILVTTSTPLPAGFITGSKVEIRGSDGNTAANGIWDATVTGASQISIPTTGNGTYTGSIPGTVLPLAFGASYQIPSDGDLISASNNNISIESLGDRTAFLLVQTGAYKLAALSRFGGNEDPTFTIQWNTITTVSTAWTTGVAALIVNGVLPNDVIEAQLTTTITTTGTGGQFAEIDLGFAQYVPGGTVTPFKLLGSGVYVPANTTASYTLYGIQTASVAGSVNFYPGQQASSAASFASSFVGPYTIGVRIWRPTGVNQ